MDIDRYIVICNNLFVTRHESKLTMTEEEWLYYNSLLAFTSSAIRRCTKGIDDAEEKKEEGTT